ncbi:hypothetical protein UK12_17650 [Saccharothrix sp. ST-888]|nr:hypothetical protein UK12_17650 [Saccharothrix sp. ST-888]
MVVPAAHVWRVILLVSSVTEPLRASARPSMLAPVVTVIDVRARMLPTKVELVPRVAELPICQKTLHGAAPLMRSTRLAEAVVRVDPTWKTQTALGLPPASSVSVPVNAIEEEAL